MTVSMQTNLMVFVSNRRAVFRKCFERVAGDKPSGFDLVLVEEFE